MTDAPAFVDGRQVARRLKLNAGELAQLVKAGRVSIAEDGRYNLEEVRAALSSSSSELTLERTVSEDAQTRAVTLAEKLAAGAMARETKMFETYASHLETLLKASQAEADRLRTQLAEQHEKIVQMQQRQVDVIASHERVLSLAHERELQAKAAEGAQRRKDQALGLILKAGPPLLEQVKETLDQGNVAKQLVASIEPGQLEALLEIGFLSDKQKALVRALRGPDPTTNGAAVALETSADAAQSVNGATAH